MADSEKLSAKEIIAAVIVIILFAIGIYMSVGYYSSEAKPAEVTVSDKGAKAENHAEIFMRVASIDPIKGDANVRIEITPHGNLTNEVGELTSDFRLYVPSSNGKIEIDFKKGKTFTPTEAVLNMYGNAADYPFDSHKADFYLYLERVAAEKKDAPKPAPAADGDEDDKPKVEEPEAGEVPLDVSFFGNIPGYRIKVENSTHSDESLVEGMITVERSSTTVAFSLFIGALMWGLSLAVLFLVLSLIIRGRKIEIAMFSFMAALLFAFYSVRGSQPNVPPIGTLFDFIFFFWAEALVALCLVLAVFVWVFRTPKA
ncbi:MAG TPA: DUF4436 family protein [Pyrinomonadaceae bacterium]|nr:DUF4436 family protein [Pyrinomonadaceae bacterium]